ncbi:hypothetical protein C8Q76DRAFT_594667, partial [Earliella scabrosa]
HPASLVDRSAHSPLILELIELGVTRSFVGYVVDRVMDMVDSALRIPPSHNPPPRVSRRLERLNFSRFVGVVLQKARINVPVLLVALVYLARAQPRTLISHKQWANERVFLGALIVAQKYTNDHYIKNAHWSFYTSLFSTRDIGVMEREFLGVLNYDLRVTEADLLAHSPCHLANS